MRFYIFVNRYFTEMVSTTIEKLDEQTLNALQLLGYSLVYEGGEHDEGTKED